MKISTFTTILLVIGLLLLVTIQMINESETNYDIEVNKKLKEGKKIKWQI